jgi:hypothetical protein
MQASPLLVVFDFRWLSHAHLKPETLAKAAEARPERGALPDCATLRLATVEARAIQSTPNLLRTHGIPAVSRV